MWVVASARVATMTTSKAKAAIRKVNAFLQEWDQGNNAVRKRMLTAFLKQNEGKTCPELEVEFAQVASLFLVRLTSWIKLTYMSGSFLGLKLKAVGVFLSASSNHRYLIEFIEVGGVLTLLEILGQEDISDEDKTEALLMLLTVSNAGQKFKELICESHGVKAIAECLVNSEAENTQETACSLLESLAHSNHRFQGQVYKGLVTLLSCNSPNAQQLVLQTLRVVQEIVKTAHPCIVEPLLTLLKSFHLEVQYENLELIRDLTKYEVREALLRGLVALLKPAKEGIQRHIIIEEMAEMMESLPVFVQQAAAARAIRMLSQESQELSQDLLSLGVVHHLLYAMGNKEHTDTQRQASIALEHFVRMNAVVEELVRKVMGIELFELFMNDAEAFYLKIDDIQADILLSVRVDIPQGKTSSITDETDS
ncbi:armadillo-like helical domain containing protein 1 isoform X1 [Anguilla anguilla]|uniref:armadillo-like helical domain containing protein 1 isoform X1 n=2 Tax=Anguilla anguilla TaxID=7936 RepID=UPI0015AAB0A7|nr:armadillo-like helical domain containing protein 1 isoform X1 [Anguilla anguilla]